jgi:hypothetical protein
MPRFRGDLPRPLRAFDRRPDVRLALLLRVAGLACPTLKPSGSVDSESRKLQEARKIDDADELARIAFELPARSRAILLLVARESARVERRRSARSIRPKQRREVCDGARVASSKSCRRSPPVNASSCRTTVGV